MQVQKLRCAKLVVLISLDIGVSETQFQNHDGRVGTEVSSLHLRRLFMC